MQSLARHFSPLAWKKRYETDRLARNGIFLLIKSTVFVISNLASKFVQLCIVICEAGKHKLRLCKQLQGAFKVLHCMMNRTCHHKYFPPCRLFSRVQGLVTLTRWQDGNDKSNVTSERKIICEYQDSDKIVNGSVTPRRCWNTLHSKFWFRNLHKHTLLC